MSAPRELAPFLLLSREEQTAAIRRLASQGWSEHSIAAATRLNVEQIRHILDRAMRRVSPGELEALRGVLEEVGRELVGRVRVGGVTYHVRASRRGLHEWALRLTPENEPHPTTIHPA